MFSVIMASVNVDDLGSLICFGCGGAYVVDDAATQFETHFGGLEYAVEITYEPMVGSLCGGCSIAFLEDKIANQ